MSGIQATTAPGRSQRSAGQLLGGRIVLAGIRVVVLGASKSRDRFDLVTLPGAVCLSAILSYSSVYYIDGEVCMKTFCTKWGCFDSIYH